MASASSFKVQDEYRKMVKRIDAEYAVEQPKPVVIELALFDIWKLSSSGSVCKPVAWGVTEREGKEAMKCLGSKMIVEDGEQCFLYHELRKQGERRHG
jgi:hypothetical protein